MEPAAVGAPQIPPSFQPPRGYALVPAGWTLAPIARTPGNATAALVLGIATWGGLLVGFGILTGWITAPLAVWFGLAARRKIEEEPERWSGRGRATAGLWLGLSYLMGATIVVSVIVGVALFG